MAQHDYDIANDTAANVRADINNVLAAIVSNNSGSTEPSVTYANQWWYDTSNNILKIRSEADDAWINVGYLDQSTNEFKPYVGGTQVDTQSTSAWEAGTSTTEGIVSPAKVAASAEVNSPVKAWVNFDGIGTVSIRESFNVSSITDNGTGDYTVNFDAALEDANYAALVSSDQGSSAVLRTVGIKSGGAYSTTAVQIIHEEEGGNELDRSLVTVAIFR